MCVLLVQCQSFDEEHKLDMKRLRYYICETTEHDTSACNHDSVFCILYILEYIATLPLRDVIVCIGIRVCHTSSVCGVDLRCIVLCVVQAGSGGVELLVSGSDDFTLFLWQPAVGKKNIARMTGICTHTVPYI